jgi:hypothetical protein
MYLGMQAVVDRQFVLRANPPPAEHQDMPAADLSYGTFLGGSGMDQALAIAVGTELSGTVYVTGTTQSVNFPVTGTTLGTIAAYQSSLSGSANAFLSVIGQNGAGMTLLLYSS